MKTYFIATSISRNKLIIEAATMLDDLSPEIYDYFGEREITISQLIKNKNEILEFCKADNPRVYANLTDVDVKEIKASQT